MAYAALPAGTGQYQDHPSRLASTSPALPEFAFEDLATTLSFVDAQPTPSPQPIPKRTIPNVLKSMTGSQRSHHSAYSYEVVEDDDYEQIDTVPRWTNKAPSGMAHERSNSREDIPARTASISRHLPLHNPTPDLQSLQGAYIKNVERLEDSAERMSLTGSIDEELTKMKLDLRRAESLGKATQQYPRPPRKFSSTSMTNSIIAVNAAARSGGYSPAAYVTSSIGSATSQRKASQRTAARTSRQSNFANTLPEPELEGRPLESAMVHSPPTHAVQPRNSSESQRAPSSRPSEEYDRPGTSASNDTYRQAQHLFTDFDGTHFSPIEENGHTRKISLTHPPLARDAKAYKEAQPGEKMVFYPAPVPVMLNLPKRLSRGDWAQQEKRRSKVLSSIPMEMRKSAIWLADADEEADMEPEIPYRNSTHMPAQLRASAFFDPPSTKANVKLQHGSAVMTLDNILDASAFAPVSAFVDHPIVGQLGKEVYGPELGHKKKNSKEQPKRRNSLSNLLGKRMSSATFSGGRRMSTNLDNEVEMPDDDLERAAERSMAPGEDELSDEDKEESEEGEEDSETEETESQHQLGFLGAPTTLLAELQMRKAEQKLRNRTAANAFPKGMHSTLLELDAVSQLQKNSRKRQHVALAWEDREAVDKANNEDEDVPLGVLFPEKDRPNHVNVNRPIGLMEKREIEENEPLSHRRARLRGEPIPAPPPPPQPELHEDAAPVIELSGIQETEVEEEIEDETLAQRRERIRKQKEAKEAAAQTQGSSLADGIASELGIDPEQIGGTKTPEPEVEETLGERRKRLLAEKAAALKPKTSMGDLLRANPVGSRNDERQVSAESKINLLMNKRDPSMALIEHIQAAQPGSKAMPGQEVNGPRRNFMLATSQSFVGEGLPSHALPQHWPGRQQLSVSRPGPPLHTQTMPVMGQYGFGNMQGMQSMPNLNLMAAQQQQQQMQYPFNQNMDMRNMSLGMNNMGYNPMMMTPGQMQIPMHMNMNMNMPAGGINAMGGHPNMGMGMSMGYGMPNMNMTPYDAIGMGPPLTNQQRNTIDHWRQSVA